MPFVSLACHVRFLQTAGYDVFRSLRYSAEASVN
jgi:hypothetical protein